MRTVSKRYLSSEVVANFIENLHNAPTEILPISCDSPTKKNKKNNNSSPWKNDQIKHLRKIGQDEVVRV